MTIIKQGASITNIDEQIKAADADLVYVKEIKDITVSYFNK